MVLLPLLSRCVGIPPPPSPPPAAAEGEREAAGVAQPLPPSLERAAAPPPPHGASPGRVGTTRDGEGTAPGRERARSRAGRRRTGARIPLPPGRRSRSGSGRSAAPPLGEGGRDASRVLLSPAPRAMWALPAGLLRSGTLHAVKRKGGVKRQPRSPSRSRRSGSLQVRRARSRPDGPSSLPRAPPAAWYGPPRGTLGSLGRAARPWRRPGGERAPGVRAGRQRAARRRLAYRAAAAAGPGPPNCLWGLPGAWALSAAAPAAGPRHSRSWAQGRGRRRKSRHFA